MVRPNVADKKLIDSQYPLRVRYIEITLSTNIQKLISFSRMCQIRRERIGTYFTCPLLWVLMVAHKERCPTDEVGQSSKDYLDRSRIEWYVAVIRMMCKIEPRRSGGIQSYPGSTVIVASRNFVLPCVKLIIYPSYVIIARSFRRTLATKTLLKVHLTRGQNRASNTAKMRIDIESAWDTCWKHILLPHTLYETIYASQVLIYTARGTMFVSKLWFTKTEATHTTRVPGRPRPDLVGR